MTLKSKIYLIVMAFLPVLFASAWLYSAEILKTNYAALEESHDHSLINDAKIAVDTGLGEVASNVEAWAWWDRLYEALSQSPEAVRTVVDDNFPPGVFTTYDIDLVIILDPAGKLLEARRVNADRTGYASLPQGLSEFFSASAEGRLLANPPAKDVVKNIISTPDGLLFIASTHVFTTRGIGEPHGTFIFGRFLSNDVIQTIKTTTELNISIYPRDMLTDSVVFQDKKTVDQLASAGFAVIHNNNSSLLYGIINDADNKPVGFFRLTEPRFIHNEMLHSVRYMYIWFAVFSLMFLVLLMLCLQYFFLSRIRKMTDTFSRVSKGGDFSVLVHDNHDDELSALAVRLNHLTASAAETNSFMSAIFGLSPAAVIVTNENFMPVFLNNEAQSLAGSGGNSDSQKSIFESMSLLNGCGDQVKSLFRKSSAGVLRSIRIKEEDGSEQFFDIFTDTVQVMEQKYHVLSVNNITAEENSYHRLEQSDRLAMIGRMTAGVAHNITNPINIILTSVNPVQNNIQEISDILNSFCSVNLEGDFVREINGINTDEKQENLNYTAEELLKLTAGIKWATDQTAVIVRDLRVFTRFDGSVMSYNNINTAIDLTVSLLNQSIQGRISVVKHYGELPDINCHLGKLIQVFLNIIMNAINAMPPNGELIITTEKVDSNILIHFKDNGSGLSAENLQQIFDPFFSMENKQPGSGMGLYIANSIVHEHGGHIEVKSELHAGSDFIVILPVQNTQST